MPFKKFFLYPRIPPELEKLFVISKNLWFTWNYDALSLFYKIDPVLFRKLDYNPIKLLCYLPKLKLSALTKDKTFLMDLKDLWEKFIEYINYVHPEVEKAEISKKDMIVYFCTEFGFHPALPIYAGGLGVLAGDHLIAASDLGVPITGIGLLYHHGYLNQKIDPKEKVQIDGPETLDLFLNFLEEVKTEKGEPLIFSIPIMGTEIKIKPWKIQVGRVTCYFLDANLSENSEEIRDILRYLYPGDPEVRIQQEIILGIGGYKLLKVLNLEPKVFHLNEGHSAFVLLARLKDLLAQGFSFDEAKLIIKATTVFTTHTPVIAGNEHFHKDLIKKYLWEEIEELVELTKDERIVERFYKEGILEHDPEIYWLPACAINNSCYVNAVSKLHQKTTKKMWHSLFKNLPEEKVPIDYITNGVHWRWISEPFYNLLKKYIGPNFIYMSDKDPGWEEIFKIPDEEIWEAHRKNKYKLITYLKTILKDEFIKLGLKEEEEKILRLPKAQDLIIGCARRVTGYKRNTLILYNKEKILDILRHKDIILVFAGKAHPKDFAGKDMIREILEFREKYHLFHKIIFLENYNLHLARYLIWGSDVWLNTPLKPMEACGTSGIKAAMNGVLHLSVVDGWWFEGYNKLNGWAIYPKDGLPPYNDFEANQIYTLIEKEIYPLFTERDEDGIPRQWVKMMKHCIYNACKNFSANRMILEYLNKFYVPAIKDYKELSKNEFELLKKIAQEKKFLEENWDKIHVVEIKEDIEKKLLLEEEKVDVTIKLNSGPIPPELLEIHLVLIEEIICTPEEGKEELIEKYVKSLPLKLIQSEDGVGIYQGSFYLFGTGLKEYNFGIFPKSPYIKKYYPELVKWIY